MYRGPLAMPHRTRTKSPRSSMFRRLIPSVTAALLLGSAFLSTAAPAAEPKLVGSHKDWNVFTYEENGNRVCYMASRPTKHEGNYRARGEIYVLITQRPAEKSFDVVSVIAGYTYQPASETTIQIGNQTFRLFTDGDTAWARDEATDRQIVAAIRAGNSMVVRGTSNRGTATTDTYSLAGSSAAYTAMNQACNISR
jgi:invasion protein IalB